MNLKVCILFLLFIIIIKQIIYHLCKKKMDYEYMKNIKKSIKNNKCSALNQKEMKLYKELTTPNKVVSFEERQKLSIKDLGLVTFVSSSHMNEAFENCESMQQHPDLTNIPFSVFISDDIDEEILEIYQKACPNAKLIKFPFKKFPPRFRVLDTYRFKAIYQAMALKNHKVLLNFDTSIFFDKNANFTELIFSSIQNNPTDVTLLSTSNLNMFALTHPGMYSCFPKTNIEEMVELPQFQSGLILWIGSENGWKNMGRFVECSLQPNCMVPRGAKKDCDFNMFKEKHRYSGCHRYDQSAINLILYEHSNFNPNLYQRESNLFRILRDEEKIGIIEN